MNQLKKEFYQIIQYNEEYFDFIQHNAFDGIWFWDLENPEKKWMNPKFCHLLGYEYNELEGNQLQKIVYKEDQEKIKTIFESYLKSSTAIQEDQIRFVHRNGKIVWVKMKALLFDNLENRNHKIIITHTNITKVYEQEKELMQTLNRYESMLNNHRIFIIRTDLEGKYTYVNDHFCKRLGLEREEIIGKNAMTAIIEKDHQKCIDAVYKCFGNPYESVFVQLRKPIFNKQNKPSNEFIYTDWEYRAVLDNKNQISEIQCVGVEVTQTVITQEELQHTKHLLQTCNEAVTIGLWQIDLINKKIWWDKITKQIHEVDINYESDMSHGFKFQFYLPSYKEMAKDLLETAIQEGRSFDEELQIQTQNGNQKWVRAIGIPQMQNGKCVEVYGTFQDITKQKQNELQLKQKITELEKAKQEIQKIQDRLTLTLEKTKIGLWELNLNTQEINWDEQTQKIFGTKLTNPIPRTIARKRVHEEDVEEIDRNIELLAQGKIEHYEYKYRTVLIEGEMRFLDTKAVVIRDENQNPTHIVGVTQDITKEKQAELKLKEKVLELEKTKQETQKIQYKFAITLEKTGMGVWELDLKTYKPYWDKQTRKMFGVSEHEKIDGESTTKKINPEDILKVHQMIKDLIKQKISQYHIVYRTAPIGGKVFYHESRAILIYDEKGKPTSILGIVQDITQQKENEKIIEEQNKELATSEQELRKGIREMYHLQQDLKLQKQQIEQIFDAVPAMIYQFRRDKEGNVSFPLVSKGAESILGVKADQILNNSSKEIFEAIHPEDLLGFQTSIQQSAQTLQKWESELRLLKNGKEVWIHATSKPTPIDDGGIIWTGIMQNIDHIKATEFKVYEQNKQLQKTLNELQETQSQLIHNEKMTTLGQLVASIAHEINTPLGAIRSSAASIEKMLSTALSNLPKLVKEFSQEQLNQFNLLVEKSIQAIFIYSSREKRSIKYKLIDELDSKKIHQSERIADMLVDMGISQEKEIYEPFINLSNAVQILEAAYQLSTVARSNATVQIATEKASKIIITLKNFSRQDHTGEKKPTSINESIENTLILYHNKLKHGIEIVRDMRVVPTLQTYEDELAQVWTNLLHNAIQAIGKKGKIYIKTEEKDNNILVSIKDTGTGIPDEVQSRIFDAFFTTKPTGEGSGLGLNIVRKIIDKHNGKIWFETQNAGENTGTTFFVELPIP